MHSVDSYSSRYFYFFVAKVVNRTIIINVYVDAYAIYILVLQNTADISARTSSFKSLLKSVKLQFMLMLTIRPPISIFSDFLHMQITIK